MSERIFKVSGPGPVHVYPVDDLRVHETERGGDCWCEPDVDLEAILDTSAGGHWEGMLVVHHSLDGRERHERQN